MKNPRTISKTDEVTTNFITNLSNNPKCVFIQTDKTSSRVSEEVDRYTEKVIAHLQKDTVLTTNIILRAEKEAAKEKLDEFQDILSNSE